MITIKVNMRITKEPVKRAPVVLELDASGEQTGPVATDRTGRARFDLPPVSAKVLVSGIERFHGFLEGETTIELSSITEAAHASQGAPGGSKGGSTLYPGMQTRAVQVGDRAVITDSEGYLVSPEDWSEAFARAQAAAEGLELTDAHWQVIWYLRSYYGEHGAQASVRDMVKHFRPRWGREKATSRHLHELFPRGGPQKQGNRLAGLLRTKGEH